MGLIKFLKPVEFFFSFFFFSTPWGQFQSTDSMTEAEYLKVNCPMLVLTCGRWN